MPLSLLHSFDANFDGWVQTNWRSTQKCFYINDLLDAMEMSISGSGCRPTINSIMYGEAIAITKLATMANNTALVQKYGFRICCLHPYLRCQF